MNRSRVFAIAGLFALSACGAGSIGSPSSPGQATVPQAAAANAALSPDKQKRKFGHITFYFKLPSKHHHVTPSGRMSPDFIPAGTQKVTVILNTVNGNAPPAGVTLKKTTVITQGQCGAGSGCTVTGPASPPGNDNFTVNVKGSGDAVLSTASKTFTIKLATANSGSLTLLGVPATFSINAPTTGVAGMQISAFPAQVVVFDAAGDKITGTFANPVNLASTDASVQFTPAQITTSTGLQGVLFSYSGLAVSPVTISASASGATTATSPFTPTVTAPSSVCNGDGSGTTECATPGPQVNLYNSTSTGSTATFTASQTGWADGTTYFNTFSQINTCSGIATITSSDNLTFTATAVVTAQAATCQVTVKGGANQTVIVPITYTTSVIGVSGRHRKPKSPHK